MAKRRDNFVWRFLARVRSEARRKPVVVTLRAMGRERVFQAYDWGADTFVFEKDVWLNLADEERDPLLVVRKSVLIPKTPGFIMTLTKGNHSVAAMPLLTGQLWNLGKVPPKKRSTILQREIVCGNIVDDVFELSQRDVMVDRLVDADAWMQTLGIPFENIVMADRTESALEHYRCLGQEWRIRPLAWTRREMELVLRSSRARIASRLQYFHSVRGIHFLSYEDFHLLTDLAREDFAAFLAAMRELVAVPEGLNSSNTRIERYHGHHEVELFGVRPGLAINTIIPQLENLLEGITLRRLSEKEVIVAIRRIDRLFRSSLDYNSLATNESDEFVAAMYRHLTGEVYLGTPGEVTSAFDDRRTALPGATYRGGLPDFHAGADNRSRSILSYILANLSHGESIEYVNVYEVRVDTSEELGLGSTREIVYKTNRMPLPDRLIEKRLALPMAGYGSYMLARVAAYKGLGIAFGSYHLLARHDTGRKRADNYFVRNRLQGDSFGAIPRSRFLMPADEGGSEGVENPDAILAVAALMGSAAAQTMVMKRYLPKIPSCRFGEGKEIIEFGFDVHMMREMPVRVSFCSVRGSMGWPETDWSTENLMRLFNFYMSRFAEVAVELWSEHSAFVTLNEVCERFFEGFASKTRAMHWRYVSRREQFDAFKPDLRKVYNFDAKWAFSLWSLERQSRRIDLLRDLFMEKVNKLTDGQFALEANGDEPQQESPAIRKPPEEIRIDLLQDE